MHLVSNQLLKLQAVRDQLQLKLESNIISFKYTNQHIFNGEKADDVGEDNKGVVSVYESDARMTDEMILKD